ncbi:MAG: hypothetical protein KDH89_03060 [Anaerolineae bacterium]|nr:hypothetical protein [Anaerolineae bacterium]
MQGTPKVRSIRTTVMIAVVILAALVLAPSILAADTWTVDAAQPDNAQCVSPTFLCKDIQAAINAAAAGDTINVLPGTYAEDITVDKSLDIRGPNYGISPNTGIRGVEAVVVPATAAIDSGEIFHVEASDVSIDGFTIDGDNTALASGYSSTNGADIDAAEAVTVYVDNINNLNVSNNIIQNLSYFGVTIFGATYAAPATTGHLVDDNLIKDMGTYDPGSALAFWGGGVLLYNGQYAAVTNNVMQNVRIGVQTGNFHSPNPGTATYQVIDNNTMQVRRRGIFHNLQTGAPSPYTLSNNDITALADANETVWDGILLASLAVASTSTNNTIDGSAVSNPSEGYEVWNVDSIAPAAISGGSVSGVDIGLFLNNYEGYSSDAGDGAHASVSGLSITPKATGIGIRVLDSPSSTTHANVQLAIGSGVAVNGGANGMTVENTNASVTSTSDLALNGQTGNYIELVNNAVDIDATGVSFDGQTGATATLAQNFAIEDKVVHKVDNNSLGLVRVKANEIFVTTSSGSIQRGINAATTGNMVNVSAGTFNENVVVNKYLTMQGAGSTASDTVVNGAGSGAGLSITASGLSSANRIAISDLQVTNFANGIQTGGVSYIGLDNVVSTANTSHGLELGNGTTDLLLTNCEFSYNTSVGIRAGTAATISDFEMDGCAVDYNNIGMYIAQTGSGTSNFSDVLIQNSTFNENKQKGIYIEKLHNATFDTVVVDHSGWDASYDFSAGVDINLKYRSDYANISFVDSMITDSGVGALYGVGLTIKARDDGSYSGNPASLDTVSITGGIIDGNEVGVRFGEPGKNNLGPTNVTVSNVCFSNNVIAGLINETQVTDNVATNWWGDASGPYNATTNPGGTGDAVYGDVTYNPWIVDGCGGSTTNETILSANTSDPLFCTGESTTVTIDLAYAVDLYGYEFQISYNDSMASAVGAFVNTFFDTTPPVSIPPAWNAVCSAGICRFAVSHISTSSQQSVTGSGQLAEVTLTGVAPGTFNMVISGDTLSDIDGNALSHAVAGPLPITVCGYANISGFITMQGRPGNIVNPGTVTMIEQAPTSFTPVAPVAFTPANGAYSIMVPYLPGGSSYKILAEHGLYLDNEDIITVSANLSNKDTRLWGGDANNDDDVTILDLSCIGGDFGSAPPISTCGGTGSPDINADNKVNIQDLSIAGGNYDKCGAQPWAWNVAAPNYCSP